MADYVTVDWDDIPLAFAKKRVLRLLEANRVLGFAIRQVYGRKSSNGKVHLIVELLGEFTPEGRMRVRAQLGDDPARWEWDMKRKDGPYAAVDYSHGVVFDRKDGKEAGPWAKIVVRAAEVGP